MNVYKIIVKVLLVAITGIIIWGGGGYLFMVVAINDLPTRNKPDFLKTHSSEQLDSSRYLQYRHRRITIKSQVDDTPLYGILIFNPHKSKRTIIFSHGVTDNLWSMTRGNRLEGYLERGYNVLLFDQRAHGHSGGSITTFGLYEKYDLDQWVDTIAKIFPRGIIGVEGVSMGAATAIMHAGLINPMKNKLNKVRFYVFDCPFSDLAQQLAYALKVRYRLPDLGFIAMLNFWNQKINGFDIFRISPISAARHIDVPVLFIHGNADEYVPVHMSKDIYNVVPSKKMIYIVPGIRHADAVYRGKPFWTIHDRFITTVAKLNKHERKKHRANGN